MSLLGRPPDAVTLSDLNALIENSVVESRFIEYKKEIGLQELSDKIKLLEGLSSFANSGGGDMLIGLRAEKGVPVELVGVDSVSIDDAKLKIEQLIQTGLSPRISATVHPVKISEGHHVLLIRVPRSWALPHRVTIQGHDKFYGRHSAGRFPMDVDQLRAAFLFSSTISERIERFRERLVDYILQAKSTIPIATGAPMLLMQVVPYESLEPSRLIDIVAADSDAYATLAPVGQGGAQRRFNADGILGYVTDKDREGKTLISAYTQLYRTGVIESADTTMLGRGRAMGAENGTSWIPSTKLEIELIAAVRRFTALQKRLSISPPVVVLVSLLNVEGFVLAVNEKHGYSSSAVDRPHASFPSVVINNYEDRVETVLRPVLDALWNAGGWDRCHDYDAAGVFLPGNRQ